MTTKMHADAIDVTAATVRRLVVNQFPQWRDLEISAAPAVGTVNAVFRIADELSARLPLLDNGVADVLTHLQQEANAAREIAAWSPVPVPTPIAIGRPGDGFPLPWAVYDWLPGSTAFDCDASDSHVFAGDLAGLIGALRAAPVNGRVFSGSGRGGELPRHDEWIEECFDNSEDLVDTVRLGRMWAGLRTIPRPRIEVMSHGDLIGGNVLVRDSRLVGLLDVGNFGPADPALDLISAWHLLSEGPREQFRRELDCADAEWGRGMAWALEQAMGAVWYYRSSNLPLHQMAMTTLSRLLAAW